MPGLGIGRDVEGELARVVSLRSSNNVAFHSCHICHALYGAPGRHDWLLEVLEEAEGVSTISDTRKVAATYLSECSSLKSFVLSEYLPLVIHSTRSSCLSLSMRNLSEPFAH